MAIVPETLTRRSFLLTAGAGALATSSALAVPFYTRRHGSPSFSHGVQSGDVDCASGVVWARTDRPSEVLLEYSTTESFTDAARMPLLDATGASDHTVKALLRDLLPDQDIFYRFTASDPYSSHLMSEPIVGRFRTAPMRDRSVRFVWSGDTAGQGWGIDDVGMKTYSTMLRHEPDFFIHSGDTIYADGPIPDEITLRDGGVWKNRIVTDEKRDVARTLDEFRGQWKYNLLDDHLLAFNSQCPTFFQWDDHEVLNNWSASSDLTGDRRYPDKDIHVYEARARQAFQEMTTIRYCAEEPGRIFRKVAYGPLLDVFFVDLRSYRSANRSAADHDLFGPRQAAWLRRELAASRATWKVIACDMPLGLVIWDDYTNSLGFEGVADGLNGPPAGRERDIADLLTFMRDNAIHNVVWLTADVHYTAAHHYDPSRAVFKDFLPFWEFVSGPLHSGTYGPKPLDRTFGPEVRFIKSSKGGIDSNLPPSAGLQFFGLVDIHGASREMTVRLMDREDQELWRITLPPVLSS
ncbi:alkaline phosphatase D family protein [Shinella sp. H4-D48]|uniref:alkaline phosphatase D family protein n=1 Tax=Shinella sp. H4-D48 TaxID=2925841 RepID=UPI001F530906|nr:alkaline phosphatase D family protein [Shinella sp. H4-D48]UNK38407.1 alkaline phosphatase D family protein [Shinella sp. H4-D48]